MALQMTWHPHLQKRKPGPPLGLKNLGNSCYLNSVLQCLTYTPPLANACLNNHHSSLCDSSTVDRKRDCAFCILERRIVRSLSLESSLDAPSKILSSLRIFSEHFRCGRQEDAHEFLRYVIDACHKNCLAILKRRGGRGDTVVKEIFGGELQSQVKCFSCGAESNKSDEIMDISLDLFQSSSLKEALHKFFQREVLDGNNKYRCENCKKLSEASKQMFLHKAPNVLVIQLKRFEGINGAKINRLITFEENLMMSKYTSQASQDPQPEYNLFGSIVHSGLSPESGHYYAYIKDMTGRWYCCNDSHVSLSSLQDVLTEKVYILFFSRSNQRPSARKKVSLTNGIKSEVSCENGVQKVSTPSKSPCVHPHPPLTSGMSTIPPCDMKVPTNPRINSNLKDTGSRQIANGNGNGNGNHCNIQYSETNGVSKDLKSKEKVTVSSESTLANGFNGAVKVRGPHNKQLFVSENGVGNTLNDTGIHRDHFTGIDISNHLEESLADTCEPKRTLGDNETYNSASSGSINFNGQFTHFNGNNTGRNSTLSLERFKERLCEEASSYLRSSDWSDKVQNYMRARKRVHMQSSGHLPVNSEIKRRMVSEAKMTLIPQLPEILKENLIERLRLFSEGKSMGD